MEKRSEFLPFFVEGTDTIYYDEITAAKVYSRLPKQKGREWRQYYRLVHNFSKAYPYALVAKKLVHEGDSTIAADNLKGAKRPTTSPIICTEYAWVQENANQCTDAS